VISFRYELQGAGWADAYLTEGKVTAEVPASYICDALRDLVDAVQSLFTTDKADCVWLEEPGEARWHFHRTGKTVQISVEWFNEIRVDLQRDEYRLVLDSILVSGATDFSISPFRLTENFKNLFKNGAWTDT
jgi:hypothetical protein